MDVTVAISTWNRSQRLQQTLARMCRLRVPPGLEWELFVVNNNCTDATDEVIESFHGRLPIGRLFEPKQGLSNARNCAIAAAAGELIIFTDDDVFVEPGWLSAYAEAAKRWPEAAYFGGPIVPEFESEPPEWMTANLRLFRNMLGIRDFGRQQREFRDEETPFGGNMAFRSRIFADQQFDPNLGRSGQSRIMGEEGVLFRKLAEKGIRGVWVPQAELKHFIPEHCFTRQYIWAYFCGHGRTFVRVFGPRAGKSFWGVPRYQIRQFCQARLKSWLLSPFQTKGWMSAFVTAAKTWGMMQESRAVYCQNNRAA